MSYTDRKQGHDPRTVPLVQDARRFIQNFKYIIRDHPLQTYASGLLFCPFQSLTRQSFEKEAPQWITNRPVVDQRWSACLITLEGHNEGVISIAWSSDGAWLASASGDGEIRIWEPTTGRCQIVLKGHGDLVSPEYPIALSSDGSQLAAICEDDTIKIWETVAGHRTATLDVDTRHARSLIWLRDGTQLALGYVNGTVRLWDNLTGQCKIPLGLRIIGPGEDSSFIPNIAKPIAWSNNGFRLASVPAGNYRSIHIWDVETGRCERILEGNRFQVTSIAWSSDCTQIASGSSNGTIRIWDPSTGQCKIILDFFPHIGPTVESIVWSSDGTRLASASRGVPVKIWSTVGGRCEMLLGDYCAGIQSVVWPSNGARLASVRDGDIAVWVTSASQDDNVLETQNGRASLDHFLDQLPSRNALQSDGFEVVSHNSQADASSDIPSPIRSITWSSNGTQLATLSGNKTVQIWDSTTGKCQAVFKSHEDLATPVAWSDNMHLKSCSINGNIKIWNSDTGRCKETALDHDGTIRRVVWLNDGTRLASGNCCGVKIWDLSTGQCEKTRYGDEWFTRVSWSGDSTQLASDCLNLIRIWDSRTAECTMTLENEAVVQSLAWSSDKARLASASPGHIKIWDLLTGRCEATFEINNPCCGNSWFLRFDDDVTHYLHTTAGTVNLGSCTMLGQQRTSPSLTGIGMNADGSWITYDGRHILWLPPEYRPVELAISGERIAIGCESGCVLIIEVAKDLIPI